MFNYPSKKVINGFIYIVYNMYRSFWDENSSRQDDNLDEVVEIVVSMVKK